MATRTASLKNQIDHTLRSIFTPNESRHAAKASDKAVKHIYSYGTLDRYREACNALVNILPREQRPKWLKDFTADHIAQGIALLRERGNTDKTIATQLDAWRKLAHGLNHLRWSETPPEVLVPTTLRGNSRERSRPQGSVSQTQVTQWRALLTERAARSRQYGDDLLRMFDLCLHTGIRIEECALIRNDMIDRNASVMHLTNNITKNGRPRDVPLDTDAARAAVEAIPTGRHWLWPDGPALARRLQDLMHETGVTLDIDGRKGPHRLRATYAEQFLLRRIANGLTERAARHELTARLGHNRIQVTYQYVPMLTKTTRHWSSHTKSG